MKIDKLTRLFEALGNGASSTRGVQTNQTQENQAANDEAVKVSSKFASPEPSDTDRAKRVADIKAQVDAGTYKPDSRAVAEAVVKDLFA